MNFGDKESPRLPVAEATLGNESAKLAAILFTCIGLPFCLLFAVLIPPFQVPDEFQHYFYASSISHGQFLAERTADGVGDQLPQAELAASALFNNVPYQPSSKVARSTIEAFYGNPYDASQVFVPFPAATIYPPFAYAFPAGAMALAHTGNFSPGLTFTVGRLSAAIAYVAIVILALLILPAGHAVFLGTLLAPTQIQQAASFSEDSLAFGLAALTIALLARLASPQPLYQSRGWILTSLVLLAFLGTIKLPYAALAIAAIPALWTRSRVAALLAPVLTGFVALAWAAFYSRNYATLLATVSPIDQVNFILQNPADAFAALLRTFFGRLLYYIQTIFGLLGWLDTPLPLWTYVLGIVAFVAASIVSSLSGRFILASLAPRAGFLVAAVSITLLIFLALYLTWSAPGAAIIEGVQGRYFVPVVLALAPAMGGVVAPRPLTSRAGIWLVAAAACVWLPTAVLAIFERYYLP